MNPSGIQNKTPQRGQRAAIPLLMNGEGQVIPGLTGTEQVSRIKQTLDT
jgi:hypothetical protein